MMVGDEMSSPTPVNPRGYVGMGKDWRKPVRFDRANRWIFSYKGHMVNALAARGDEGRRSLRKAPGSGQARDDPEMSEWGNPRRKPYLSRGANPGN